MINIDDLISQHDYSVWEDELADLSQEDIDRLLKEMPELDEKDLIPYPDYW